MPLCFSIQPSTTSENFSTGERGLFSILQSHEYGPERGNPLLFGNSTASPKAKKPIILLYRTHVMVSANSILSWRIFMILSFSSLRLHSHLAENSFSYQSGSKPKLEPTKSSESEPASSAMRSAGSVSPRTSPGDVIPSSISNDELSKIRKLSSIDFETAFEAQLRNEQKASLLSIYFMKEAYVRREWSASYSSFHRYCVSRMKMSDSDFYRKYSIMKTLGELPEIEEKILNGTINQSTVCKTIQFIKKESRMKREPMSLPEKRNLFAQIENKTEKQVERELAILSPEAARPDRTKQISETGFHRQFTSDVALEQKLVRLKELLAHTFSGSPTDCELFHRLADIALEKLDPKKRDERNAKRSQEVTAQCFTNLRKRCVTKASRAAIPAHVKRAVRIRDQYRCSHMNPQTGEICGSRFATEFDHIIAKADGGPDTTENLRLVCRTHNQFSAIARFGRKKMQPFIAF
jgi:5-methylcytosine-specific restriction endonuclease McrA